MNVSALEYHRLTVHRPAPGPERPYGAGRAAQTGGVAGWDDPRLVRGFQPMRWDTRPPQFKTYPGAEVVPLPEELPPTEAAFGADLDVAGLGRILFLSGGVVRSLRMGDGSTMWFRAAGSAGNLSPLELYVVTGDIPGLDAGVYHYEPVEHGLVRLRGAPADASPALVVTGVPWRTTWKYRERGFRHLWWDAGTMLAQTLAVAWPPPTIQLGFVDRDVAALVGAEMPHELPLAVVGLRGWSSLPEPEPEPEPVATGHLADDPFEFPLVTAAYQAGKLADRAEVRSWREAAASLREPPAPGSSGIRFDPSVEMIIRRRGSTRQFDIGRAGSRELLVGGLGWAAGAVPGDFAGGGATLLEHNLVVHGVEGVPAGAYRFGPEGLELLRPGELRVESRHLCLDQPIGGTGAYTVFHSADVARVTSVLGDRGYRAALLEAGVVEGRLHLAAYGLGYGATGLTFFDDEVSRFFATNSSPMLVTAVGAPAYRSRPGGIPRRPVRMVPG